MTPAEQTGGAESSQRLKRARVESDGQDPRHTWAQQALTHGCAKVDRFRKLNRIDEGTYGVVYRARDTESGDIVALKQLKLSAAKSEDGFPVASLREISLLLEISHPNIVRCKEVVMGSSQNHIFMVMEYVEHELKELIHKQHFSIADVKCLLLQLLAAVEHLHERWVVHRDLKPTNVLLNGEGILKVCDFGLARHFGEPQRPMTQRVQSLWYRAPELLMGEKLYDAAVDVWSVGCIFAEMFLKKVCFEGRVELQQLGLIFSLTGSPSEENWPGVQLLPNWRVAESLNLAFPKWEKVFQPDGGPWLSDPGLELLKGLLNFCPAQRATAASASKHPYFWEPPLPQKPEMMPTFSESNCEGRRTRVGCPVIGLGSSLLQGAGIRNGPATAVLVQ